MKYDYSVNITIKEVKHILQIMEDTEEDVVGLHITNDSILNPKHISAWGPGWEDVDKHIDITDYDSA